MIVGAFGPNDENKTDFSFVKEELKNLKDISRPFDECLYRKLNVSETVIDHWRGIDYRPPYYYLFWMLQVHRYNLLFGEYRQICDDLVDKICEENQKIGDAVRDYCQQEQQGYEWFVSSDPGYVYKLNYSYDDGSGDDLVVSCDFDEVLAAIRREVEEGDKDITFDVERYPVNYGDKGEFKGIDVENYCGRLRYNKDGQLQEINNIKGYCYAPMCELELLSPYIFFPTPFEKGDIVSYKVYKDRSYGVVSHPHSEEDRRKYEERGITWDGSDFVTRVETVYEYNDKISIGYDHICPLYLERYDEEIDFSEKSIFSVLGETRDILKGESGSLSDLMYFMGS